MKFEVEKYLKLDSLQSKVYLDSCEVNEILLTANKLIDSNQFDLANELYSYLLTITTDKFKIYKNLSISHRRKHNISESLEYANLAISDNSLNAGLFFNLFECYAYQEDYHNALRYQEWCFGDQTLYHPTLDASKKTRLDWADPFVQQSLKNRFGKEFDLKQNYSKDEMELIYADIRNLVKGNRIYVMSSQGMGDVIQCSRYIEKLLALEPTKVVFSVRPELYRLISKMFQYDDRVVVSMDIPTAFKDYDYFIPIFSLLKLFGVDNSPQPSWYKVDRIDSKYYDTFIDNKKKTKIGIVWRGNPKHTNDSKRSTSLEKVLTSMGDLADKTIFNLQFDVTDQERKLLEEYGVVDLSNRIKDLYDTACFMSNLDLVITVDSSPVHLAGCLGVNTLCLLPKHHEDWRWGYKGERKWYDSVKLLRN